MEENYWKSLRKTDKKIYYLKAYTHLERHEAISKVSDIINTYGYIISSNMYSDLEISIMIEIPGNKIQDLFNALSNLMKLDDENESYPPTQSEHFVFLNITFTQAAGNLKIEVPAVPG